MGWKRSSRESRPSSTRNWANKNQVYDQGEVILESNRITYCSDFGIVVASADGIGDVTSHNVYNTSPMDIGGIDLAKPGPTAPLREINTDHQVPGVVIQNNVIAFGANGGIHVTGPDATDGPSAGAVQFARIVNNTVYGGASSSSGTGNADDGGSQTPSSPKGVMCNFDRDTSAYGGVGDATPGDDAEFSLVTATDLVARPGNAANNRADLLTTVMHEMGHVLGYEHSNSLDLMHSTLPLGERRLLAGGADASTALTDSLSNHRSSDKGILDEVFASFNEDGKRDWSWL